MKGNVIEMIDGFIEIMDRADTLTAAIAAGQPDMAKEFVELMDDSSARVISGLRNSVKVRMGTVPKNSVNEQKLGILEHNYEAMEALFAAQRRVGRGQNHDIDMSRLAAIGDEI